MLMPKQAIRSKQTFRSFTARLPGTLWDDLKKIAEKNKRSTTGQIEFILQNYLDQYLADEKNEQH